MDQATRGLMVVFNRCNDAGRQKEFERWCKRAHLKAKGSVPGLLAVSAYVVRPSSPTPGRATHVALYEFSSRDPKAAHATLRAATKEGASKTPDYVEEVKRGFYRRQVTLHPPGLKTNGITGTKGILLAMLQTKGPQADRVFEGWYVSTHLHDEARHGVWHSVIRFLNVDPRDEGKSLSILETNWDDVEEARNYKNERYLASFRYPPGIRETSYHVIVGVYQRVL